MLCILSHSHSISSRDHGTGLRVSHFRAVVLNAWSQDQRHQHYLRTYETFKFQCPTLDLWLRYTLRVENHYPWACHPGPAHKHSHTQTLDAFCSTVTTSPKCVPSFQFPRCTSLGLYGPILTLCLVIVRHWASVPHPPTKRTQKYRPYNAK